MSKSSFGTRVTCDLRRQERRTASTLPHYRESQVIHLIRLPLFQPPAALVRSQPFRLWSCRFNCFNSRAPHGARRWLPSLPTLPYLFQFTRPAWGATLCENCIIHGKLFQFTAQVPGFRVSRFQTSAFSVAAFGVFYSHRKLDARDCERYSS